MGFFFKKFNQELSMNYFSVYVIAVFLKWYGIVYVYFAVFLCSKKGFVVSIATNHTHINKGE